MADQPASGRAPGHGADDPDTGTGTGTTGPAAADAPGGTGHAGRRGGHPVGPDEGPDSPTQLPGTSIWAALKRTVREFQKDNLTDWAAALTYYAVLSLFPALLVLVSVLGLRAGENWDSGQRNQDHQ